MKQHNDGLFWIPLNAGDFYCKTASLSLQETGVYILCLVYLTRHDYLPNKMLELKRITKGASQNVIENVLTLFESNQLGYYDSQIVSHRVGVENNLEKRSEAGKIGANARWQKSKQKTLF